MQISDELYCNIRRKAFRDVVTNTITSIIED